MVVTASWKDIRMFKKDDLTVNAGKKDIMAIVLLATVLFVKKRKIRLSLSRSLQR